MSRFNHLLLSALVTLLPGALLHAEEGFLVVHVSDVQNRPISGVVLGTKGDGSVGPATGNDGKTRILLAAESQPSDWVSLQIVRVLDGKDLVFISPWDRRATIPPFANESDNFVPVVLAERGDKLLLTDGKALLALAEKLNTANRPKTLDEVPTEEDRQRVLADIATEHGLEPADIDEAIRAWGANAKDPYEKGVANLYAKNYPEASKQLSESFHMRKSALEKAKEDMVNVATFLGQSLYEEGKYRKAAEAYREASALRPDDMEILSDLGSSLYRAGEYSEAEPLLRRSLENREQEDGPDNTSVAYGLNDLAILLQAQGKYSDAEPLYRRALEIHEAKLGKDHPSVATGLNNLAGLLQAQGKYSDAEPLFRRALEIDEAKLGKDHPSVAIDLNNLAILLQAQGDLATKKRTHD